MVSKTTDTTLDITEIIFKNISNVFQIVLYLIQMQSFSPLLVVIYLNIVES